MMTPFTLFKNWYSAELKRTRASIPSACCLSTNGLDGFPNARYVSLKEVAEEVFIVTGPFASRKGEEIRMSNKVALTFWWSETERQVRIQGKAETIADHRADRYFAERSRDAQLVAITSRQGEEIDDPDHLHNLLRKTALHLQNQPIKRPADWGGFAIKPVRIEFMEFRQNRLHERMLYEWATDKWTVRKIQP
jgi:pyridoxamine 5'-phosphate oxidase